MLPYPPCPAASLAALARSDPGRASLIQHDRPVSCADLDDQVTRIAAWLARQGLAPGQMVGVTLREERSHLAATLALLRLGCPQVALASHDPVPARAELATRCRAVAVLAETAQDGVADVPTLVLPDLATLRDDPTLAAPPPVAPIGESVIVFTSSGTTGRPKLVPTHARTIAWHAMLNPDGEGVRYLPVGIEHVQARRNHLQAIVAQATILLAGGTEGMPLRDLCIRHRVVRLLISPQRAEALLTQVEPGTWPPHTMLMVTGAPVPGVLRHRLQAALTREVHVVFGSTESGAMAIAGPRDHALHPDGVGRARPEVEMLIADPQGRALPLGETGELRIRSPGVVAGYLDDPAATARAFRDGWYAPGDVGRLTPDGTLLLEGRGDDMMLLGTMKISPAEIERAAQEFQGLRECAAFPLRSATLGDIPVLAAVAEPGAAIDPAVLLAHCRARLGMRAPRRVVLVPVLPRNAAGKVLRRDLAAMARGEGAGGVPWQ